MKKMTSAQIRQSWIDFFVNRNHYFLPPASLIPVNDPSLLWINSGVATLKDYFSGKKNPPSNRLVNSQKALRTNDFFNVGLTSRHQTFFEMLGNFSIGDYFKVEAINFAYDLLVNEWEIDPNLLWITTFNDDDVAYNEWKKLGIDKNRILKCNRDRNFWDVGNGPCGPCTEIYYDRGPKYDPNGIGEKLLIDDIENDRYVEIWNIVFSQFSNDGKNNYTELTRKNIDTGAGLERIACISQDVPTNFDTDLFQTIIRTIETLSNYKYNIDAYFNNDSKQLKVNFWYKVISDHLRASVFAIADGAIPSNKERGYVLRRLIRRAIVFLHHLGINDDKWIIPVIDSVIGAMQPFYAYLLDERNHIIDIITKETNSFSITLANGLKILNDAIKNQKVNDDIVFDLVTTYGFPIEIIKEISSEYNITIDENEFKKRFAAHQKISNANKHAIAMEQQNDALLKLDVKSEFLYDQYELDAEVIKLYDSQFHEVSQLNDEPGYVVFDKTIFYATSGGQQCDTGYINKKYYVDNVIKAPNFQHIHHLTNANLSLGEIAHLAINIPNRKTNMAHHSSEHLLQSALLNNISKNIKQNGAFKSPQKFSFDFQHPSKLTDEQLTKIEHWINNVINQKIPVEVLMLDLDDAKKIGAIAHFEEMYKKIGGKLRVVKIGDVSTELCGGTHVHNTSEIEQFAIISHYSRRSGEWRIEAISTFQNINNYRNSFKHEITEIYNHELQNFQEFNWDLSKLQKLYNDAITQSNILPLWKLSNFVYEFKNNIILLKNEFLDNEKNNQIKKIKDIFCFDSNNTLIYKIFDKTQFTIDAINSALIQLVEQYPDKLYLALFKSDNKLQYIAISNKKSNLNALEIVNDINTIANGKGAGKINYARGGATSEQLDKITNLLQQKGFICA